MDNKTRIEKEANRFAKDILGQPPFAPDDTIVVGYKAGYTAAVKEIIQQVEAYPMLPEEKEIWLTYLKGLIE